jgi:hypothetical protein
VPNSAVAHAPATKDFAYCRRSASEGAQDEA